MPAHISTRQYTRLVHRWVESISLESASYGTHSIGAYKGCPDLSQDPGKPWNNGRSSNFPLPFYQHALSQHQGNWSRAPTAC
jgi:hypothetical protein